MRGSCEQERKKKEGQIKEGERIDRQRGWRVPFEKLLGRLRTSSPEAAA